MRLGYELQTAVRFPEHTGRPSFRIATVAVDGEPVFRLTYGQAATLWRINLGWARRQEKNQFGFVLDTNAATGRKTRSPRQIRMIQCRSARRV